MGEGDCSILMLGLTFIRAGPEQRDRQGPSRPLLSARRTSVVGFPLWREVLLFLLMFSVC